jgi:hypothetical protein
MFILSQINILIPSIIIVLCDLLFLFYFLIICDKKIKQNILTDIFMVSNIPI